MAVVPKTEAMVPAVVVVDPDPPPIGKPLTGLLDTTVLVAVGVPMTIVPCLPALVFVTVDGGGKFGGWKPGG